MTANTVTISLNTYETLKANQMYFEANVEKIQRQLEEQYVLMTEEYKKGCKIAMVICETRSGGIREIEIHDPEKVAYTLKKACIAQIHELRNQCVRLEIPIEGKWYAPLLNLFK